MVDALLFGILFQRLHKAANLLHFCKAQMIVKVPAFGVFEGAVAGKFGASELFGPVFAGAFECTAHAGLAESGADAKHAIEEGLVSVNGETAYQRGKKLVDGDTISYRGQVVKIEKP